MKIKVECGNCKGTGQATEWKIKNNKDVWSVKDCSDCGGIGKCEIEVIDKRIKTKRKSMIVPDRY